jgi:methylphosphotriester-DNA--protein-cysteine methyltransferase
MYLSHSQATRIYFHVNPRLFLTFTAPSQLLPDTSSTMSFATESSRWRALTIRDATANGQFVYTVKSTMIYCRPTCPARLARRANVGFYKTSAQAQAAGFRACKRCRPEVEEEENPQERKVAMAVAVIHEMVWDTVEGAGGGGVEGVTERGGMKRLRLKDLADRVGVTPRYFHKIFKDRMGVTPNEYAKRKLQEQVEANSLPKLSGDQQATPDSNGLDAFDINEFLDLGIDPELSAVNALIIGGTNQTVPTSFGQELDANLTNPPWNGDLGPEAILAGLYSSERLGDPSILGLDGWNGWDWDWDSSTSTSKTMELDASFLPSVSREFISDCHPDPNFDPAMGWDC